MDEQTYFKERLEDQISWLESKSGWNQKRYKRMRTAVIVLSVSLPFATGFISESNYGIVLKIGVGLAGVVIAILEGLQSLNKYQENWIAYRASAENLKREKMLYLTQVGDYAQTEEAFKRFVMKIEMILNHQDQNWQQYIRKNNSEA
ncbi:MAG: DUF4231 domain-containing protein [Saprospiraceae bacterium]|nr:DUF4231 domain-containing protein [Saprospiraceae bacterium]